MLMIVTEVVGFARIGRQLQFGFLWDIM